MSWKFLLQTFSDEKMHSQVFRDNGILRIFAANTKLKAK